MNGIQGWAAFDAAAKAYGGIPDLLRTWIDPEALGAIDALSRDRSPVAALAAVTYADDPRRVSWVLYVKSVVPGGCPRDVQTYANEHLDFPNETTVNQFFTDEQWECYRAIGQQIGASVIRPRP